MVYMFNLFDNMFVGNKKKVIDTLIEECTQKKLAKCSNFFIWVYLSENTEPLNQINTAP